jgi:shikimate dehydrogenase
MTISGRTRVYGVIGDPIEHTLSPPMHNAAFNQLGLDCVFLAFRVRAGELENAVRGMRALDIRGLNVTMPHKGEVSKYLDEVDSTAKLLGSVNTIRNDHGRLSGFSVDGIGALQALQKNGVSLNGKKLLLLGGGGAARALAFAVAKEVDELVVLNRTPAKTKKLAEVLNRTLKKKVEVDSLSPEGIKANLRDADILVNATSVGMRPQIDQSLVQPQWLKPDLAVMDIIYDPLETKLVKDAKAAGARVIGGVEMLIYQGAASFEIWTDRSAPVEAMRKAVLNELSGAGVRG